MTFFLYRILFGVLFWIWVIMTLVLTSVPGNPEAVTKRTIIWFFNVRLDYIEHFVIYFMIPILYILWKIGPSYELSRKYLLNMLLAGAGFAILTELQQLFVPGRAFNLIDMVFNVLGILVGIASGYFLVVRQILAKKNQD